MGSTRSCLDGGAGRPVVGVVVRVVEVVVGPMVVVVAGLVVVGLEVVEVGVRWPLLGLARAVVAVCFFSGTVEGVGGGGEDGVGDVVVTTFGPGLAVVVVASDVVVRP